MERQITEAARSFALSSRVECHALSVAPLPSEPTRRGCALCEAALRGHVPPERADATHRFAAYQSERLGGRYAYVCNYTLLHAAAPVIVRDEFVAVLVSGPAVLGNVDDEIRRAILASQPGSLMSPDAVGAWLDALPCLAPDEASALADTLARVALSCSDREGGEYLRHRPKTPQQSSSAEVASYIDHLTSMEGDKHSTMAYPIDVEQRLLERISAGDRTGAELLLDQITQAVTSHEVTSSDEARSRVLELVVLISRAAIAGGADAEEVFGLEYRSLARLRTLQTQDEIIAWLRRILARFVDLVFDLRHLRFSGHLSRVLAFLRDNFREPISLSDAAREAGLSSGYLSRIFRSELHSSFTGYLKRLRMQEARRLLRRTTLPIGDVAAQCGFSDHSYFAQIFHRETGCSPTDYRVYRAR